MTLKTLRGYSIWLSKLEVLIQGQSRPGTHTSSIFTDRVFLLELQIRASLLPYSRKLSSLSYGPRQENQSSWQTQPSVSMIKGRGNAPGVRMGAVGSERINESEIPLRMGPGEPTPEPALLSLFTFSSFTAFSWRLSVWYLCFQMLTHKYKSTV